MRPAGKRGRSDQAGKQAGVGTRAVPWMEMCVLGVRYVNSPLAKMPSAKPALHQLWGRGAGKRERGSQDVEKRPCLQGVSGRNAWWEPEQTGRN